MEIIYTNGMITINETMIVIVVSFLVLVFILNRLMFRPLLDTIQERNDHLSSLDGDINAALERAADLNTRLREQELAARQEGNVLKTDLETAGKERANEIVSAARETILTLKQQTQKEVNAQVAEARKTIQQDSERLSLDITAKILGRELS